MSLLGPHAARGTIVLCVVLYGLERSLVGQEPADPSRVPICGRPNWLEVADQNEDGRPDVLAMAYTYPTRNVAEIGEALGDGNGGLAECSLFRANLPLEMVPFPDGVAFGDFDGDGDLDLLASDVSGNPPVLGEYGPGRILLFLRSGPGLFTVQDAVSQVENRAGHLALETGDLDGDGNLDLIFSAARTSESYLQVLHGNGNAAFAFERELRWRFAESSAALPEDIEVRDFDGNGLEDLAVLFSGAADGGRRIEVFLNRGPGPDGLELQSAWETRFPGTNWRARLKSAVLNPEGRIDLVIVSARELEASFEFARLYRGRGDGRFVTPAEPLSILISLTEAAVADFDEDGRDDLVLNGELAFQVLLSSEGYQTARPNVYLFRPASAPHSAFKTGDLNGDGHLDLVVPDSSHFPQGNPSLGILPGDGHGRFAAESAAEDRCGKGGGVVLGDFDEDGTLDVLTAKDEAPLALPSPTAPCILLGRQQAADEPFFELAHEYPAWPTSVLYGDTGIAGDLNGDRHLDVVAGACMRERGAPGFTLRFGNGRGELGEPAFFEIPARQGECGVALAVEDFDGDALADLLAMYYYSSGFVVSLWLSRGDGQFTESWSQPVHFQDWLAADVDGDGLKDVLGMIIGDTPGFGSSVLLLRNAGQGTFESSVLIEEALLAGGNAQGIARGDFNQDGEDDVALAWRGARYELRIYLMSDGAVLSEPVVTPIPGEPLPVEQIEAADVNGDSRADIVFPQWEPRLGEGMRPHTLKVLYGQGEGRLSQPVVAATGLFTRFVVHDVNRDSVPDFIVAGGGVFGDGLRVILQDAPVRSFFLRGDCNSDRSFNITDPIALLGYLFLGAEEPACLAACGVSGGDTSPPTISDAVLMLNVLFLGARPAVPVPSCEAAGEPGSCAGAGCRG